MILLPDHRFSSTNQASWFLVVVFVFFLGVPVTGIGSSEPVRVDYDHGSMFPVTRNRIGGPNDTGNNYYYTIDRIPGTERVGIAASGHEDLLLYGNGTFEVRRMDPVLYHRELQWLPEGGRGITGASRLPPDTGGAITSYNRGENTFGLEATTPLNTLGIALREGEILAVGGQRYPHTTGALYRIHDGQRTKVPSPREAVYQDVSWSSNAGLALVVADAGILLEWNSQDELDVIEIPGKPFLKTVAWHPSGEYAVIGGGEGALYRYESGSITEISLDIDWTIHDIAWHESGDFAFLVGGIGTMDEGYWARYEDVSVEQHRLSRPLFSVEWMNADNAVLGGQRVIWRYSQNHTPDVFGLRASLSISHDTAAVGQKITLSGFGSTYKANADSVAEYGFRYDRGDTVRFQTYPDHNVRFERPGEYHPQLIVRSPDGETEARDSATITIQQPQSDRSGTSTVPLYALLGFMLVLGGGIVLILLMYWQVGDVEDVP